MKDHWTLRLTGNDMAGNKKVITSTIDLGVRKELVKSLTTAPKLFSPNNDQKLDTSIISYEVADACNLKIDILDGNGQVVRTFTTITTAAANGNFVWDGKNSLGSNVSDGVYSVRLLASLTANLQVTQSETVSISVDTAPPVISITDLADKSYLNRVDLSIAGTINDTNLAGYTVTVTGPSGTAILDAGTQNRANYTFGRIADLAEDTYTLTVDVSDQGENQIKLIRTFTIDRTVPKVTLDAPKSGEYYGNTKNVIDISGSIVEKNLDRYSLRYGVGETPADWKEVAGGDTIPVSSKFSSLKVGKSDGMADGVYTLSLYAKDKAGLEGEIRSKIIIDNTAPQVSITSPKDGDYVIKPIDIKGTAADSYFDTGTVELAAGSCITAVKWAAIKTLNASVQDSIIDSWKVLPSDGEYCLRLSASDKSGNKSEAKIGIKIDTHPTTAPQLTGKIDNKADAVLTWTKNTESDLAGYNLYRDSQRINTAPLPDVTYRDPALKEGSYTYTVKTVDLAGNESVSSNTTTLKIDLAGPTVRISTPGNGTTVSNLIDIKGTAYSQDDFKEYRVYIAQGSNPSSWALIRRSPLPITFGSLTQWDTITSQEGAQFTIKLEGEDLSGNISSTQALVTIDNTPPKAPVLLTTAASGADVALTWKANTDSDLAGYLLYRNDQLASVTGIVAGNLKPYLVTGTAYTDKALPDGAYRYYLVAMDQAGNYSDQSNTLEVTIDIHPPHMTITSPANGQKFDGKLMIKAETPDNDIATVQFQYKRSQDTSWINLGVPLTKSPFISYIDPKLLGLAYGDYQVQVLSVDKGGKSDPTPPVVTVTYADITPPAVAASLAAKVNGADVTLTWIANTESDLAGYNVYRWNNGTKTKVNGTLVNAATLTDGDVLDGTYQYEVTSVDMSGNESAASGQVTAKIYAPIVIQPYTPVKTPPMVLEGSGAEPSSSVEITTVTQADGMTAKTSLGAEPTGSFRLEGIHLSLGETNFTVVATDSVGNISKASNTVVVAYGEPPAAPTGLSATVTNSDLPSSPPVPQGFQVSLSWHPNTEANLLGYNIFKDGVKLNSPIAISSGTTLASSSATAGSWPYKPFSPALGFDKNAATSWQSVDQGSEPYWWEIDLLSNQLISHVEVHWGAGKNDQGDDVVYGAKDFEVQAWSGYAWIPVLKVAGNDKKDNTFDLNIPYYTGKIRLYITAIMADHVRIAEVGILKDNPVLQPSYQENGLHDGTYNYTVTALNTYGFESILSELAVASVGDVTPPAAPYNLTAEVVISSIVLDWSSVPNTESDLAGYNVYLQTDNGWTKRNSSLLTGTQYTDPNLRNGTYRYRITAVDQVGNESGPSNEVAATISIAPPSGPMGLRISPVPTGGTLVASWQSAAGKIAFYNVYRSTTPGGVYARVNTLHTTALSYTDKNLKNGVTYYYVVTAVDSDGNESAYSTEANGIPLDLITLQPGIFRPTLPGTPVTVYEKRTEVAGFAEPGASVEIQRSDVTVGSTTAYSLNQQIDKVVPLDFGAVSLSPDKGLLASALNNIFKIYDLSSNSVITTLDLPFPDPGGMPLWSPSGRFLIFSGYDTNGNQKAAIYDRETKQLQNVAAGVTVSEHGASWSTSNDTFVFSGVDADNKTSLWLGNPTVGSVVRLTNVGSDVYAYPFISPDGTRIAYNENGEKQKVFNRNNGSVITIDERSSDWPRWSPDGSKLAFSSYRDGDGDIYTFSFATGEVTRHTNNNQEVYTSAWSPDGSRIGYETYSEGNVSFVVVDKSGVETTVFTADGMIYGNPEWRSNGDLVLFDQFGLHTIKPPGYFSALVTNLAPGENSLAAISTDASGNRSQPSEPISVILDTGMMPDLAIAESDITLFPPVPKPGEDVLVTARVHNPTNIAIDNTTVGLYLWDGASDVTLLKSEIMPHLDANGEGSVSVRFNAGAAIGTRTVIAVADPDSLIAEVSESNNYASKDLIVTDQERVSVSTSLGSAQYGLNQDATIGVTVMNSGTATSGTLKVMIEDSNGNLVKLLTSQPQDLAYGLDQKLAFTWNTGVTYMGSYKVHALIVDSTGTTALAENATLFNILPDVQVDGVVTTDRQSYGSGVPVVVTVTFNNSGANYVIPQLKARVRIVDAQNSQLFSEEKIFTNLLPSTGGSFSSTWNTGLSPPGAYTAIIDLSVGDRALVSKPAAFSVLPQSLLKGTLVVDSAVVLTGRGFSSTYTISNQGNGAATGTVRLTLQDPESQTIVASSEQLAGIPANGSILGSASFDTTGLALKTYQLGLWFKADTTWQNIAMATIAVKDGIPPKVSIVLPQAGMSYDKEATLSVYATDDASGVDRVEYSIDNGTWNVLPLVDPSTGRYSAVWTPALTDNGGHTVFFRGIDRAGNTGQPAAVYFIVQFDTIPPTLAVSTLADGSYTNNVVLNVSGTVRDDQSGVKELTVNNVSVPVNPDGSFSQAVILAKGANTISAIATDLANNQASDSRTIYLDQAAPNLVITSPADNSKTATALATVSGTVDEASTVTIKMGSDLQNAAVTGTNFSTVVTLIPGTNTIEVTATDLAGNTSTLKRTVVYDDQKPSLAITQPAQDIRTNQSNLTIRGTASDPYTAVTVSIAMDGQTYTPAVVNGQFEQPVTFTAEKSYAIVVTATNEVGAFTTAQRNVIFDVTPPALTIDPVITPTALADQMISGTREAGTTVSITCAGAVVGTIEYPTATTWRVQLSNLVSGNNAIIATSIDSAVNTATASAKITYSPIVPDYTFLFAVFGNKGVTVSGGCYTDSYIGNPVNRYYGQYKNGDVGTNSLQACGINLIGGVAVFGKALVGTGGNPATGVCINGGSSVYNKATGTLTSTKSMTPKIDPGGGTAMGAMILASNTKMTLSDGDYRFTQMDLSGDSKLTLNGNVTLHIDGNLMISGSAGIIITSGSVVIYVNGKKINISGGAIVNTSQDPRNLILYGTAGLQTINLTGGTSLYGLVFAPTAAITVSGGQNTYGSLIGNTVDLSGGVSVHFDESLSNGIILN